MRLVRDVSVFAAAVLSLLHSLPAFAQEESDKGGLPQLDTSLFPEQLFWLAISFGVLYLLMSRLALPRVTTTKDNRKQVIANELKAAQQANEEAKLAIAQVEKSLSDACAHAQANVIEMVAKTTADANEKQVAQEKELLRKLHRAEEDIAVTREAALAEIRGSASDLAATVIEKILGSKGRAA